MYAGVGSEAYPPALMLKIVLYEFSEGRCSPSQWHRDARDHIPLRWLGEGIAPSRTACYSFRDRMGDVLPRLNAQVVRQARDEGYVTAKRGVLDGTAIRAAGSRHQLVHFDQLERRTAELKSALAHDAREEPLVSTPRWMAKTAGGRQQQQERYRQAAVELARRLARNEKRPKNKRLKRSQVRVSLSEPEAPLGRDKEKVFTPLYTAEALVEPESLLVLSYDVFPQVTDAGALPGMLDRTAEILDHSLQAAITDAAYASLLDIEACWARGVELFAPLGENDFTERKRAGRSSDAVTKEQFEWLAEEQTYRCPQGHRLLYKGRQRKPRRDEQMVWEQRFHCPAEHCRTCPLAARCVRRPDAGRTIKRLEGQELLDAHRARMATAEARAARRLRSSVIERCFADQKHHRQLRRFHGRGLRRARAEYGLFILTHNAITLARQKNQAPTPTQTSA